MTDKKDRKFVGNGKKAGSYDIVNITIERSKLEGHWFEYNGRQFVKLTVGAKKEVDEYGKSHAVWLNEFKPDPTYKKVDTNSEIEEVDLPF